MPWRKSIWFISSMLWWKFAMGLCQKSIYGSFPTLCYVKPCQKCLVSLQYTLTNSLVQLVKNPSMVSLYSPSQNLFIVSLCQTLSMVSLQYNYGFYQVFHDMTLQYTLSKICISFQYTLTKIYGCYSIPQAVLFSSILGSKSFFFLSSIAWRKICF